MTIYTPKLCEASSSFIPKSTYHETLISCYSQTYTGHGGSIESFFPRIELEKKSDKKPMPLQDHAVDMNILDLGKLLKKALTKDKGHGGDEEEEEDAERIVVYQV